METQLATATRQTCTGYFRAVTRIFITVTMPGVCYAEGCVYAH